MSPWELRFKYNLTWNRHSRCNKHQILTGHFSPVRSPFPSCFKSLSGRSWLSPHSFDWSLAKLPSWWTESLLLLLLSYFWPPLLLTSAESHSVAQSQTQSQSQSQSQTQTQSCVNSSSSAWDGVMPSQTLLNISTAQRHLWYFALQDTCAWLPNLEQSCWSPSQVFWVGFFF